MAKVKKEFVFTVSRVLIVPARNEAAEEAAIVQLTRILEKSGWTASVEDVNEITDWDEDDEPEESEDDDDDDEDEEDDDTDGA